MTTTNAARAAERDEAREGFIATLGLELQSVRGCADGTSLSRYHWPKDRVNERLRKPPALARVRFDQAVFIVRYPDGSWTAALDASSERIADMIWQLHAMAAAGDQALPE